MVLIKERNENGKYEDIIDFMTRLRGEVINKRQLEKLIQAGCFDKLETNRAKLFANVKNFVEIFGGNKESNLNQSLLFEDSKISFLDENLFEQNNLPAVIQNNPLDAVVDAFANAVQNYGISDSVMLVVVQPDEKNIFDQPVSYTHLTLPTNREV